MKPSHRRAILSAMSRAGVHAPAFTLDETARGHIRILSRGRVVAVVPGTPGDARWLPNLRADLRRASRTPSLGFISRDDGHTTAPEPARVPVTHSRIPSEERPPEPPTIQHFQQSSSNQDNTFIAARRFYDDLVRKIGHTNAMLFLQYLLHEARDDNTRG